METDSFYNLLELLKSQFALYSEIDAILAAEKEAVVGWRVAETSKFGADKKRLERKERILEEARLTLVERIKKETGIEDGSLSSIISACHVENIAAELAELKDKLLSVSYSIAETSASLKILYATNIKLINDMYAQMGYLPTNKYGTAPSSHIPGTISALG